jgi:glycosyltransferase involved in cell wall biosynthesis
MHGGVPYVDEVWTYSRHAASAIRRAVDLPVHVVPPPVLRYPTSSGGPHPLDIDADFSFLFCFDVNSSIERKYPEGVVHAFRAAFAPGSGPTLIIKSHNGRFDQLQMERLRYEARDRRDIHIVDAVLDVGELRRLIATCGCYVSLHRAEGFGYTMAEAMLAGVPVIATRYSGNLEFMDDDNSFLVEAGRSVVTGTWGPYPAGSRWAEPDLDDAARLMRLVYRDPDRRKVVAEQGRRDIELLHSPGARAPLVAARLAEIRARIGMAPVAEPGSASTAAARVAWRTTRRLGQLARRT